MTRPEELEHTAKRVKKGENGPLLKRICSLSYHYLKKVAAVNGFVSACALDTLDRLVNDAVAEAIPKWPGQNYHFVMSLRSVFLHCCRKEMRERRLREATDLLSMVTDEEHGLLLEDVVPDSNNPVSSIHSRESYELAKTALTEEPVRSRSVVSLWMLGASHKEISQRMKISYQNCRQIKYENVRDMKKTLRRKYPDVFGE